MERVQASWNRAAKSRPSGWDQPAQPAAPKPEQSTPELSRPYASPAPGPVAGRQMLRSSPLPPRPAALPRPHSSTAGHRYGPCSGLLSSQPSSSGRPEPIWRPLPAQAGGNPKEYTGQAPADGHDGLLVGVTETGCCHLPPCCPPIS